MIFHSFYINFLDIQDTTNEGVIHVDHWNKFILVRLEYIEDDKASNVLHRSAAFCKLPISWNFNTLVSLEETETVIISYHKSESFFLVEWNI